MMEDTRIIELFFERDQQAIRELDTKYGKISSPAMRLCSFIKKKSLRMKAAATRSIAGNPRF